VANADCSPTTDYDGERRLGSWDIGADELNRAAYAAETEAK
jgi:hypothetical protein